MMQNAWVHQPVNITQWCRVPHLSSETEVSIALLCQLCLTCYTAVQIKNCLKSTSVLKVATMKSTDDFSLRKGSHHVQLLI